MLRPRSLRTHTRASVFKGKTKDCKFAQHDIKVGWYLFRGASMKALSIEFMIFDLFAQVIHLKTMIFQPPKQNMNKMKLVSLTSFFFYVHHSHNADGLWVVHASEARLLNGVLTTSWKHKQLPFKAKTFRDRKQVYL